MQEAKKLITDESIEKTDVIDITEITKAKSSLNAQYLSERDAIIREFGSLKEIRIKLGLTKSKIAQLLLIKPATWSRWERNESKAPPHIFQALKWYLVLSETKPEMRALTAPEFIYENQLKQIGSELKKISQDSNFKNELMSVFENKLTSVITQGLSQIQFQMQPMQTNNHSDDTIKLEQFKIQSQVQNVEYLLRQMREDMTFLKTKEVNSNYQTVTKPKSTIQAEERSSSEVKILSVVLGTLAVFAVGLMTYFFIMYA